MSKDKKETQPELRPLTRPSRPGRNEECHCGSGKKYKKCHLEADEAEDRKRHQREVAEAQAAAAAAPKEEKPAQVKPQRNSHTASQARNTFTTRTMFMRKTGGG